MENKYFSLKHFKDVFFRPSYNVAPLDGLRAIAILLVVGLHISEHYVKAGGEIGWLYYIPPFKGGWIGVPLFFTLSGFLIGTQIWKEYEKTGTIQFWRFFFRRGFRIWPLYYFCYFTIWGFGLRDAHYFKSISLWANAFFYSNYSYDMGPINGAWSISTEEHFYILSPLFMIIFSKLFGKRDLAFYRKVLIISFFVPILFRYLTWNDFYANHEYWLYYFQRKIYRPIHTNCEGLIMGMIISNYFVQYGKVSHDFLKKNWLLLVIGGLVLLASFKSKILLNFTGVAIGFGAFLWTSLDVKFFISKILSWRVWFPIAKTSFGIYLINMPVIEHLYHNQYFNLAELGPTLSPIVGFTLATLISFGICVFLYVLVEKPFLVLRGKVFKPA